MSTKDSQFLLNKEATYRINGLQVRVKIVDVKLSYGQTRFLIQPVAGTGEVWVDQSSVVVDSWCTVPPTSLPLHNRIS